MTEAFLICSQILSMVDATTCLRLPGNPRNADDVKTVASLEMAFQMIGINYVWGWNQLLKGLCNEKIRWHYTNVF